MAVCEICGCKTDELDFVVGSLNGEDKKMCSFCHKQFNSFGESLSEAQLRWLKAIASKDVSTRSDDTAAALRLILSKYDSQISGEGSAFYPKIEVYNAQPERKSVIIENVDKDQLILELISRVEKLENTLLLMKRKQIIKTILEIGVPLVLGIIILIVFFSSGLYDTLAGLYGSFM